MQAAVKFIDIIRVIIIERIYNDVMCTRAERFLHYPFFCVHVSFIIKIRGSGTGPGYPPGRVFCAVVAGNSWYISSEGILAMTGRDKLHCSQVKGVEQQLMLLPAPLILLGLGSLPTSKPYRPEERN